MTFSYLLKLKNYPMEYLNSLKSYFGSEIIENDREAFIVDKDNIETNFSLLDPNNVEFFIGENEVAPKESLNSTVGDPIFEMPNDPLPLDSINIPAQNVNIETASVKTDVCHNPSFYDIVYNKPSNPSLIDRMWSNLKNLRLAFLKFLNSFDRIYVLIFLVPVALTVCLVVKMVFFDTKKNHSKRRVSLRLYTILEKVALAFGLSFFVSSIAIVADYLSKNMLNQIISSSYALPVIFSVSMCLFVLSVYLFEANSAFLALKSLKKDQIRASMVLYLAIGFLLYLTPVIPFFLKISLLLLYFCPMFYGISLILKKYTLYGVKSYQPSAFAFY